MRTKVIAGNWKMYKTKEEAEEYVKQLLPKLTGLEDEILLAVPFTYIQTLQSLSMTTPLKIGAQNMNDASMGAYTGEIAAEMLLSVGAQFVLLGHSERRHIFKETDEMVHKKVKRALETGLTPIFCLGETLEERDNSQTEEVLDRQLQVGLDQIKELGKLKIAYEPVWAIGTGKTATPEMAQQVHLFIREWITKEYSLEEAEKISILYGGSVKPDNAQDLLMQEDIDGLLIGGASLQLETFVEILQNSAKLKESTP